MKIRQINPKDVKVGDRFRADLGNVKELCESIQEKGLIQPITVDEDLNLLAGGRRLAAFLELGIEKIDAVVRKTTGELDAREIELFENIHRKDMTWHERAKLIARIHALLQEKHGDEWSKIKSAKLIGKSRETIRDATEMAMALELLPDLHEEPNADAARKKYKRIIEDAVVQEALGEAKTKTKKRAVVWAADHYQVADALKRLGTIADAVMNFAEVDPPYAIDLKAKRQGVGQHLETYDEIPANEYPEFIEKTATQIYRILGDNTFCVWWHGPSWAEVVKKILESVGFTLDPIPAIWYKPGGGASNNPDMFLARCYEPFYICRKGLPLLRARGRSNVFAIPGVPPAQRIHATERPVELMQEILNTFAWPGATIIVPFLGSGNTLIAAYKEGMIGFGYDKSQKHREGFLTRVAKTFPEDFDPREKK